MSNFEPIILSTGRIIKSTREELVLDNGLVIKGNGWTDPDRLAEMTRTITYKMYVDNPPYYGKFHLRVQGEPVETDTVYEEIYSVIPNPLWSEDLPALKTEVINEVKYKVRMFLSQFSGLRWEVERAIATAQDANPIPVSDETKLFRKQVLKVVEDYEQAVNDAGTFEAILAIKQPLEPNPAEMDKIRLVEV